jgi:hypothetical protein
MICNNNGQTIRTILCITDKGIRRITGEFDSGIRTDDVGKVIVLDS